MHTFIILSVCLLSLCSAARNTPARADLEKNTLSLSSDGTRQFNQILEIKRKGDSELPGSNQEEENVMSISSAFGYFSNNVISAVRDQTGRAKLISWSISQSGLIHRVADSGFNGLQCSDLDVTVDGWDIVLAVIDSDISSSLKLLHFLEKDIGPGGIMTCADSGTQGDPGTMVRVVHITENLYVTAVRTVEGTMRLASWRLNRHCSFTYLADSGNMGDAVSEISLVKADGWRIHCVVTSVRDGDGNLKVIVWHIEASRGTITRVAHSNGEGGSARMIRSVSLNGRVFTSAQTKEGNLRIISWQLSHRQFAFEIIYLGDLGGQTGKILDNSLAASVISPNVVGLTSAVSTLANRLMVITFAVSELGSLTKIADSGEQPENATLVTSQFISHEHAPFVTTFLSGSNKMKLISWIDPGK